MRAQGIRRDGVGFYLSDGFGHVLILPHNLYIKLFSVSLFIKLRCPKPLNSAFGRSGPRLWKRWVQTLEALNKRRFLGAFGPMINFKRARAYKSVHNAKLRFSLTVKV
jgi:hypothetical protein